MAGMKLSTRGCPPRLDPNVDFGGRGFRFDSLGHISLGGFLSSVATSVLIGQSQPGSVNSVASDLLVNPSD